MKRAIYVGENCVRGVVLLNYGMTGEYDPLYELFSPDGDPMWHIILARKRVYIPSEDQTRHCPKP